MPYLWRCNCSCRAHFFQWTFSSKCIHNLSSWLGIHIQKHSLNTVAKRRWKETHFKSKAIISWICSLSYHHEVVWHHYVRPVQQVMHYVKHDIKQRITALYSQEAHSPVQKKDNLPTKTHRLTTNSRKFPTKHC